MQAKRIGLKFPFSTKNRQTREEITKKISIALSNVEDMLYDRARAVLPRSVTEDDIQESVQLCRIHLWQKSMPKFNGWQGVKLSTFLYQCITNFMLQERRKLNRKKNHPVLFTEIDVSYREPTETHANNCTLDRAVEALSLDILTHPEKYLTPVQVNVFKSLIDSPDIMMKDLAKDLAYARASSLSMIKRRINERIGSVSIDDFNFTRQDGPSRNEDVSAAEVPGKTKGSRQAV